MKDFRDPWTPQGRYMIWSCKDAEEQSKAAKEGSKNAGSGGLGVVILIIIILISL